MTFPDPAGDAPGDAPDVTGITIAHTFADEITFSFTFANRTTLAGDNAAEVLIDSEQNTATGVGSTPKIVSSVKAGSVFSVRGATVKLSTDEVFTPDALTARATIGGKALKPRPSGLAWKTPTTAHGKKLVVTMNASFQGMQAPQKLTLRIR